MMDDWNLFDKYASSFLKGLKFDEIVEEIVDEIDTGTRVVKIDLSVDVDIRIIKMLYDHKMLSRDFYVTKHMERG